ncbi:MAG: L-2-hydroxyglutarate oxidase [Candidatus Tyrphobacter sp.]
MFDVAVIGGGIVGLATGRELLARRPRLRLLLLEKEDRLASHQSSRNSGVVHSGIYYRPGTMRATLCRRGAPELLAYCDKTRIPWRRTGKTIVAVEERELAALDALYQRGAENGVRGLVRLDAPQISEREPHAVGIAGIFVPETAVLDYPAVAAAFAAEIASAGGEIVTGAAVTGANRTSEGYALQTTTQEYRCKHVIACAGLGSDGIARAFGGAPFPRIEPVRGEYLALGSRGRNLVNGCIYPVPAPHLPFLGAHVTPRIDGSVWLGPSDEAQPDVLAAVRRFVPDIDPSDTEIGGFGIRAQGVDERDRYIDDFVFETVGNAVLLRNAPSPAATACMAIARHLGDMVSLSEG